MVEWWGCGVVDLLSVEVADWWGCGVVKCWGGKVVDC